MDWFAVTHTIERSLSIVTPRGCKGDIINVDGDNDLDLFIAVDIDRAVRLNAGETHLSQDRVQLLVPLTCRLFKFIQRLAQSGGGTNVESLWLFHVDW